MKFVSKKRGSITVQITKNELVRISEALGMLIADKELSGTPANKYSRADSKLAKVLDKLLTEWK